MKIVATIFTLVLIAVALAWAIRGRDDHDFSNRCSDCHVGLKDPSILTKNADHLCLTCHPDQKQMTHPTGMYPSRQMPDVFPLYKGKMLCITCHIAHRTYGEKDAGLKEFDRYPYLLRFKQRGKTFCYQCHDGRASGFHMNKTDSHAVGFVKAHSFSHDDSLKEILDGESRECLSCHDGILSRDTAVNVAMATWDHGQGIAAPHPIGVDYQRVFVKNPKRFRHPASLDKRIKLVKGKVACLSCHTHFSKHKRLLVMDNRGGRLCLQCHNI